MAEKPGLEGFKPGELAVLDELIRLQKIEWMRPFGENLVVAYALLRVAGELRDLRRALDDAIRGTDMRPGA